VALELVSRRELGSDEADNRRAGKFCANSRRAVVLWGFSADYAD
jgi:hypothetical protein